MTFTRQDLYTFLIGLGAAAAIVLAEKLLDSEAIVSDPTTWAIGLATGLLSAIGRYLITYLAQKGFSRGN